MDRLPTVPSVRQNAIDAFLKAGNSICPFAKIAADRGQIVYVTSSNASIQASVFEGVKEFITSGHPVLIFIAPLDYLDHQRAQQQAHDLFMELSIAFNRLANPRIRPKLIRREVEKQVRPLLRQESPIHPMIGIPPDKAAFTIAMGPSYQPSDPRYAPHNLLVVTWVNDVKRASETQPLIVQGIRTQMAERTGHIYDANQLYRR